MPEYLSPGIYMEEVDKGPKPIEGVGTAMPIFIGLTEKAEEPGTSSRAARKILKVPALVTNWEQYVQKFGDFVDGVYLPHAVNGYFTNGGTRCYVMSLATLGKARKVIDTSSGAAKNGSSSPPAASNEPEMPQTDPNLMQGKQPGEDDKKSKKTTAAAPVSGAGAAPAANGALKGLVVSSRQGWSNRHKIEVEVTPGNGVQNSAEANGPRSATFEISAKLTQRLEDGSEKVDVDPPCTIILQEEFKKGSQPGEADRVERIVVGYKKVPRLIELSIEDVKDLTALLPTTTQRYTLERAFDAKEAPSAEATDPTGWAAVEKLDDVTMVVMPDAMLRKQDESDKDYEARVLRNHVALVDHCEKMKDRVAILDVPKDKNALDAKKWRMDANFDSSYATLYYPWIEVTDPITKRAMMVPPSGHVAGIWARSDNTRGVHKAPANEVVRGITGVEYVMTKGEQDSLNPIGVNCIRNFPGMGIRVWGARTVSSNPSWRYINIRRLYNFVEKSIERGTQWVVFEPNDPRLWARVRRDVSAFLLGVWREGALFGLTPDEAYYVKCDAELNPPESRREGKLFVEIGMAPVYPAEFVIFRISQWAGPGSDV